MNLMYGAGLRRLRFLSSKLSRDVCLVLFPKASVGHFSEQCSVLLAEQIFNFPITVRTIGQQTPYNVLKDLPKRKSEAEGLRSFDKELLISKHCVTILL